MLRPRLASRGCRASRGCQARSARRSRRSPAASVREHPAVQAEHHQRDDFRRAQQAGQHRGTRQLPDLYQQRDLGHLRAQQGHRPAGPQQPELTERPQRRQVDRRAQPSPPRRSRPAAAVSAVSGTDRAGLIVSHRGRLGQSGTGDSAVGVPPWAAATRPSCRADLRAALTMETAVIPRQDQRGIEPVGAFGPPPIGGSDPTFSPVPHPPSTPRPGGTGGHGICWSRSAGWQAYRPC
jgi:hypothetical protein